MTDKLTTFDVLMYVVPGAALWTVLGLVAWWHDPSSMAEIPLLGDGGLLASVLFLLMCLVGGLVVQAAALTLDRRLRPKASLPWVRALDPEGGVLTAEERAEVVHGLLARGLLRDTEQDALTHDPAIRRLVFLRARDVADNAEPGSRARIARMYSLLTRGLATVSALGATLLAVRALLWVLGGVLWLAGTVLSLGFWDAPWWFAWPHVGSGLLLGVSFAGIAALLADRTQHTDRGHARAVLRGAAGIGRIED